MDKHEGVGGFVFCLGPAPGKPRPGRSHGWMPDLDHFRFLIHHCLMRPFSCEAIYKFRGVSSWGQGVKLPGQTIYKPHLQVLHGAETGMEGEAPSREFVGMGMRNFSPREDRDGELSPKGPNGKFTVHIPKGAVRKHADARPHKLTVSATKL